jgi:tetratricopeptide (TPR) repeat protein
MQGTASIAPAAHTTGSRVEAALALRARGRLEEALDLLNETSDYSQDVFTLRGDLQMALGRIHEAVGSYSTVIAINRENLYAHQNLATCLRQLKRWEPAAESYRKLLAHDAYCDSARIRLGDCLLHLNRPEEALSCFEGCWSETALTLSLFGKAVALQSLRRWEEAEALYKHVLQFNPGQEEALANLIALSVEMFDLVRVERYALRLYEQRPDSPIAWQALALVAMERREYEDAARFYFHWLENAEEGNTSAENPDAIQYRPTRESLEQMNRIQPGPVRRSASGRP